MLLFKHLKTLKVDDQPFPQQDFIDLQFAWDNKISIWFL